MIKDFYISVDIEASGQVPNLYSMLSLGACTVDSDEPQKEFYVEIKPKIGESYEQQAINVTGDLYDRVLVSGVDPKEAMRAFALWLEHVTPQGYRPIMVGHNSVFDWQFINYYFTKYLDKNPLGICCIDMKSYAMGMLDCNWSGTTKKNLPKYLKSKLPHTHNALDDAKEQADMFNKMLEHNMAIDYDGGYN